MGVSLVLFLACSSTQETPGGAQASTTGELPSTAGSNTAAATTTSATTTGATGATTTGATGATTTGATTTGATGATTTGATTTGATGAPTTAATTTGTSSGTGSTGGGGQGGEGFTLSSPAFEGVVDCSAENPSVCDVFPEENISYMESPNNSPELTWAGVPPGTQSLVVGLVDLTYGQPMWALWNIPPDLSGLPANIEKDTATPATPAGSQQSNATFAEGDGYFGPESPCNVYQFTLYALSTPTFSPEQPEYVAVVLSELEALGDVILGSATLRARNKYGTMCE